jgi:UDP-N-acetylmuramoylalanine--D-glutamate ligase
MLRAAGRDARAVGNIGEPITAHAGSTTDDTILVVEASSFQLEIADAFDPRLVVFLNLFPDHLDRHASFEEYANAKARIFRNQKPADVALVNAESAEATRAARATRARILPFRPRTAPGDAERPVAAFVEGTAVLRGEAASSDATLFRSGAVAIPGAHTRGNLLAAAAAARLEGAPTDAIESAVRAFRGLPNAFERLGETRGVVFINDSRATTIDSVIEALASCDAPVIAILGGRLKAGSFDAIREDRAASARLRAVCAIGESRDLVRGALAALCPVELCASMDDAVDRAMTMVRPGDIVLLSPGCASFDMFTSYAARGDAFRRAFERIRKAA